VTHVLSIVAAYALVWNECADTFYAFGGWADPVAYLALFCPQPYLLRKRSLS
jgi:hypothetical protein